jgi:hypothetical protein
MTDQTLGDAFGPGSPLKPSGHAAIPIAPITFTVGRLCVDKTPHGSFRLIVDVDSYDGAKWLFDQIQNLLRQEHS